MDRIDKYCLSAPLILAPEFLCNLIIPLGPSAVNCINLGQCGGGVLPLFSLCLDYDTNGYKLSVSKEVSSNSSVATPNASQPSWWCYLLTLTGCTLLDFLYNYRFTPLQGNVLIVFHREPCSNPSSHMYSRPPYFDRSFSTNSGSTFSSSGTPRLARVVKHGGPKSLSRACRCRAPLRKMFGDFLPSQYWL